VAEEDRRETHPERVDLKECEPGERFVAHRVCGTVFRVDEP